MPVRSKMPRSSWKRRREDDPLRQHGQLHAALYPVVDDDRINDIKYLCSCEPTANVAVEVLCTLVKGKTLG